MMIIIRRYYVLCTRYVNNPKAKCSEMSRIFPSNSVGVIDMHPTNLAGVSLMTLSRSTLRPSLNAQLQDSNCCRFKSYLLTNFAGSLSLVLRSISWPFGAGLYSPPLLFYRAASFAHQRGLMPTFHFTRRVRRERVFGV